MRYTSPLNPLNYLNRRNNPPSSLYDVMASNGVNLEAWVVVAMTFQSKLTPVNELDSELCMLSAELPVWLRVFFMYFQHSYDMSYQGFKQMRQDLLWNIYEGQLAISMLSVVTLLNRIKQFSGKDSVVLCMDECISLLDQLYATDSNVRRREKVGEYLHMGTYVTSAKELFSQFISTMNALQDNDKPEDRIAVLFSGLHDGPFQENSSSSNRPLECNTLRLLSQDDAVALCHCKGLHKLAAIYEIAANTDNSNIQSPTNPAECIARFFARYSAGLPRAIEVIRDVLSAYDDNPTALKTVKTVIVECARRLEYLYPTPVCFDLLCYALYGRAFTNKDLVNVLRSDMSQGNCMLIYENEQAPEVTVYLAPLRLAAIEAEDYTSCEITKLQWMLGISASSKELEHFLCCFEIFMRQVRNYIMQNKREIQPLVDYSHCTFQELLFNGNKTGNDANISWLNPALAEEHFDFTENLFNANEKLSAADEFPKADDADLWVDSMIIMKTDQCEAFQRGTIMIGKGGTRYAIVYRDTFTEINTTQEVDEVMDTWKSAVKVLSNLGWKAENILLVFTTNRYSRQYRQPSEPCNVIFLCRENLQAYLGPTAWSIFSSQESLLNLRTVP